VTLWRTAQWLPIALDLARREVTLVPVTERMYRELNFLDDRFVSTASARTLPLEDLAPPAAGARDAPLSTAPHVIFHIAFCGSTLIARCLDHLPAFFVLKEPLVLHQLAEPRPASCDQAAWYEAFDRMAALLARTFRSGQQAVVKPTDASTVLLPVLLRRCRQARAVFLHCDLEQYLTALLREPDRRGFARARLAMLADFVPEHPLGAGNERARLGDGECIAALWWTQMQLYLAAARDATACRSLDFDVFLADPTIGLTALARAFGAAPAATDIDRALTLELGAHAKERTGFTAADRRLRLEQAAMANAAELKAGRALAARLCEVRAVPAALPGALTD
jgi:hypothetical protein